MEVKITEPFVKDFLKMPQPIQKAFGKQLGFLLSNLRHPSLDAKIIDPKNKIWQARVTKKYRFYFTIEKDLITLREIGPHK